MYLVCCIGCHIGVATTVIMLSTIIIIIGNRGSD
jgi:hypothetical protein